MKIYFAILLLTLVSARLFSKQTTTDSIKVRVHNTGKFYIKKFVVVIQGKEYAFSDIWKNKYSNYLQLPYIWATNDEEEITIVRKRFMQYDAWITQKTFPVDHIGDKKITTGEVTINVATKRKAHNLVVKSSIVKS